MSLSSLELVLKEFDPVLKHAVHLPEVLDLLGLQINLLLERVRVRLGPSVLTHSHRSFGIGSLGVLWLRVLRFFVLRLNQLFLLDGITWVVLLLLGLNFALADLLVVLPVCFLAVARAVVLFIAKRALLVSNLMAEGAFGFVLICDVEVVVVQHALYVLNPIRLFKSLCDSIFCKDKRASPICPVLRIHICVQTVCSVM